MNKRTIEIAKNMCISCWAQLGKDLTEKERLEIIQLIRFTEDFLYPKENEPEFKDVINLDLIYKNIVVYSLICGFEKNEGTGFMENNYDHSYYLFQSFLYNLKSNKTFAKKNMKEYDFKKLSIEDQMNLALELFRYINDDYYFCLNDLLIMLHKKYQNIYFFSDHPVTNEKLKLSFIDFPIVKIYNQGNYETLNILVHEMQHQIDDIYGLKGRHLMTEVSAIFTELISHDFFSNYKQFLTGIENRIRDRINGMNRIVEQLLLYDKLFQYFQINKIPVEKEDIRNVIVRDEKIQEIVKKLEPLSVKQMYNYLFSYSIAKFYKENYYKDPINTLKKIRNISMGRYYTPFLGIKNAQSDWLKSESNYYDELDFSAILSSIPTIEHQFVLKK